MKRSIIRLCFSFVLLTISLSLHAQLSFDWAQTQGSKESDNTGSCKIDHQGNIYTTVILSGTADLDPGPGENMAYVAEDAILVLNKYNQDGGYEWSAQFKSVGHVWGSIAEVKNNRIQIVIYYTDTLTYLHNTSWMTVNPGKQVALLSLNLDGQLISYQHLSNNHELYFIDFLTQADGSILAGGSFEGTTTFATPDSTMTIHSLGYYDAFVARFNENMQVEWIKVLAGKGDDIATQVLIGLNDLIYFTLYHDSTITIQTRQGQVVCPADGYNNSVFGSINKDGTIETAFPLGGAMDDQIRAIAADEKGNMYISGYFEGDVNFQHASETPEVYSSLNDSDGFVAKYTPDGVLLWAKVFATEYYGVVHTLRLHRNTHLYLSGLYKGRTDLDPGPDSFIVQSGAQGDLFACKLDTDGHLNWAYTFVGFGFKGIRNLIPAPDGRLFVYGYYFNKIDCDPGPNTHEIVSQGGSDVFLIGLTEAGVVTHTKDEQPIPMLIYPNPAQDYLEIRTDTPIEFVDVYSSNGARILQFAANSQHTFRINTSALSPGLYNVCIKTTGQIVTQKFLKME